MAQSSYNMTPKLGETIKYKSREWKVVGRHIENGEPTYLLYHRASKDIEDVTASKLELNIGENNGRN